MGARGTEMSDLNFFHYYVLYVTQYHILFISGDWLVSCRIWKRMKGPTDTQHLLCEAHLDYSCAHFLSRQWNVS